MTVPFGMLPMTEPPGDLRRFSEEEAVLTRPRLSISSAGPGAAVGAGVGFDKIYYESNTYLLGKELVQRGLDMGVLYRREDGSVWCDMTKDGLDEKLLLRKDGTSVYMTQDLGTALLRHNDFGAEQLMYVVGNEQDYHFKVLKLILNLISHRLCRFRIRQKHINILLRLYWYVFSVLQFLQSNIVTYRLSS